MSASLPARHAVRLAAVAGLLLAAAVALWWLGSSRIALDRGSDASRHAAHALLTLALARGMVLAVLGLRLGAVFGGRVGSLAGLGLLAPAWPVVVLAWSASTAAMAPWLLAEAGLLAGAAALALVGAGLRRALRPATAELLATALGTLLVAALWFGRGLWAPALA